MRKVTLIACLLALPVVALSSYIYVEDRAARKIQAQMRVETQIRIETQMRAEELQAVSQALNQAMACYTADKGKPPETLDDLTEDGYLKGVPKDLIASGYFKGMPRLGPGKYFDPAPPPPPGSPKLNSTPRT